MTATITSTRTSITLLVALLLTVFVHAQNTGQVQGRVLDGASGTYLDGASVVIEGTSIQTTSERGGQFTLTNVPAGSHTIRVQYLGFPTYSEPIAVTAGGVEKVDVRFGDGVVDLEPYVVHSSAMGQARALNIQKSSPTLANVVSADAIGQFPDQNAAEALSRLPGISVERDQGEGRFVVVRGIDPNLNSVAVDGVQLASPSAGARATLLDTIPTDNLQRLEVQKSVLPSMPGDSVGGYINIRTPSAYDYDSMVARLTMQANYSDLASAWKPKISGSYGDTFAEGKVGLMISASYEEREFGSDNNEAGPWEVEDGNDASEGLVTEAIEFREYNLKRVRTGISANLEFRPTAESQYFIRGSWNEYQDTEFRHAGIFEPDGFTEIAGDSFVGVDTEFVREMKEREENMRIFAASIGGENTFGDFTVDYQVSLSSAEEDTPYDFETAYELNDTGNFRFTRTNTNHPGFIQLSGPAITDPDNYEFDGVVSASQIVDEDDLSGEINATYSMEESVLERIQFGLFARHKNKTSDLEEFESDGNPAAVETFSDFSTFNNRDPYQTGLPYVDQSYRDFFLENEPAFAMERAIGASDIEDFDSEEDIIATYLMGVFDLAGTEVVAGGRFEDTKFSTSGFIYNDDDESVTPNSARNDYNHFLPGLHVRRPFGENTVLRFSANQTISRPNFEQTIPGAEIEGDEVTVGNPLLDPLESTNLDLSVEYYIPPLGLVSAAIFYKDIKNFIYEQTLTGDFAGITDAEITTFLNGPSGDIKGIEFAVQQQLTFLPAPFDGLGLFANVAFIDGNAEVLPPEEGGETRRVPFVKQSDTVGNIALTYENRNFFFRVAGTFRSDYLDEVGAEPFEDRYIDDYFQVDVSSHYRINENFTVFANLLNITDEPLKAYWGESNRLSQFEEYGWSANGGIRWTY